MWGAHDIHLHKQNLRLGRKSVSGANKGRKIFHTEHSVLNSHGKRREREREKAVRDKQTLAHVE